jgi:hypothetical protein
MKEQEKNALSENRVPRPGGRAANRPHPVESRRKHRDRQNTNANGKQPDEHSKPAPEDVGEEQTTNPQCRTEDIRYDGKPNTRDTSGLLERCGGKRMKTLTATPIAERPTSQGYSLSLSHTPPVIRNAKAIAIAIKAAIHIAQLPIAFSVSFMLHAKVAHKDIPGICGSSSHLAIRCA